MYIEGFSTVAPLHDFVMNFIHLGVIIPFVLVNIALVYFIVKYRRRGPNDVTSRVEHNSTIEVVWTVIPSLVCLAMFVLGIEVFDGQRTVPENAVDIQVTAKQWAWEFQYPAALKKDPDSRAALKSYNQLFLKAEEPVRLIMKATDVLHSFFVPAFRVKEDVVPGMYTYVTFTPLSPQKEKGKDRVEFDIFCTEYCGKDHSYMLAKAHVLEPAVYESELGKIEEEASNVTPEVGQSIWQSNCRSCHSIDGSAVVGPSFKGLYGSARQLESGESVTADENYITESVLNPNAKVAKGFPPVMPPQDYSEAQIQSIIEYMKTLQ